ncbi:LutC/YkgG family protein [Amycolatopsis lurida]
MEAREAILARISAALRQAPAEPAPVERAYRAHADIAPGTPEALALLTGRLLDYKARVHTTTAENLPATLAALLADAHPVVVPPALPASWGVSADVVLDRPPLGKDQLDTAGSVLTAARLAIAETATIVLDGEPDQGRRAITLIPDRHICVLRAEQVLVTVPEAIAVLAQHPARPLTWIAGPSATSDIELERVEGVHGPRTLDIVITTQPSRDVGEKARPPRESVTH